MQPIVYDKEGSEIALPPHALEILNIIRQSGAMVCTGSCHQQKKEHLHCRQIGKTLNIGFSAVWSRVNDLLKEGLVQTTRTGEGPANFVITPKGQSVLDAVRVIPPGHEVS
ncbi:MAG TPA: hypothetical protein VMW83_05265 [Spirochaetia bacterium]|nr:hypothetical protein [Spirochaetia bacterium]